MTVTAVWHKNSTNIFGCYVTWLPNNYYCHLVAWHLVALPLELAIGCRLLTKDIQRGTWLPVCLPLVLALGCHLWKTMMCSWQVDFVILPGSAGPPSPTTSCFRAIDSIV